MNLIDTNIFLEILLSQEKSETCKSFLSKNMGAINISDFTLHSIGVILLRQNEKQTFLNFISDTLPKTNLLSLPKDKYDEIVNIRREYNLDFDDSYQYSICKYYDLILTTMDKDFKNVKGIKIQFL